MVLSPKARLHTFERMRAKEGCVGESFSPKKMVERSFFRSCARCWPAFTVQAPTWVEVLCKFRERWQLRNSVWRVFDEMVS